MPAIAPFNTTTLRLLSFATLLAACLLGWALSAVWPVPAAWRPAAQVVPIAPNAADVGFAQSMRVHHAQAIELAMLVKDHASGPIAELAQSIVVKQNHELGLMEGWLTAWGHPVVPVGPAMAWVENWPNPQRIEDQLYAAQCRAAGGQMAGQATPEQLGALKQAQGRAKEKLFLELMAAHHEAAIPMADFAYHQAHTTLIRGLTRQIIQEQSNELAWIQSQLVQYQNLASQQP